MMRSMFAGVTGLRNHQVRMDVIGNNIANVNTVAYKSGRVDFQEAFSQTLRGASSPTSERGGTNPQQVGLGTTLGSVDVFHTQGSLQMTGGLTDLSIEGAGFFILDGGGHMLYTRAGNLRLDASGNITGPGGMRLLGWMATDGVFGAKDDSTLLPIRVPIGEVVGAKATSSVIFAQNLDSGAPVGESFAKTVDVFDSLGNAHTVVVTFEKIDDNEWDLKAEVDGSDVGKGDHILEFDENGTLIAGSTGTIEFSPPGASTLSITLEFDGVTQYRGESSVSPKERDGYQMGSLETFTIDANGVITGVYSNGLNRKIAQVAVANFVNPAGLLKVGNNNFTESNNSGLRQIGEAGTGGRGMVAPGTLEMSNVDLSLEFTDMILTQRGFQANSRIIGATDEMLQELVNLKR